jgi:plastocyanin
VLPGVGQAATHTVKIEGMQFVPATLTVKRGDKVVWQNQDVVPHTATAKGKFDSCSMATGKSWSHAMGKAGRFDYVCTFHPGMKAVVVVQ